MSDNKSITIIACSFFLCIFLLSVKFYNSEIAKAKAGLQECVVVTPSGYTHVVWQKECK